MGRRRRRSPFAWPVRQIAWQPELGRPSRPVWPPRDLPAPPPVTRRSISLHLISRGAEAGRSDSMEKRPEAYIVRDGADATLIKRGSSGRPKFDVPGALGAQRAGTRFVRPRGTCD